MKKIIYHNQITGFKMPVWNLGFVYGIPERFILEELNLKKLPDRFFNYTRKWDNEQVILIGAFQKFHKDIKRINYRKTVIKDILKVIDSIHIYSKVIFPVEVEIKQPEPKYLEYLQSKGLLQDYIKWLGG